MKKLILIMAVLPTIASFGQNQKQFTIQKPKEKDINILMPISVG
jgi:hypothetical protein